MNWFFGAILGSVISASAIAAPSEILKCSSVADSVKRLVCFDSIAAAHQSSADRSAQETTPPVHAGKWVTRIEQSKVDDSTSVFLTVDSSNEVSGRYGKSASPTLVIRCREGVTAVIIDFDGLFMSDTGSYGQVTFRVGKEAAFTRSLGASTNHQSLGLWSGSAAIPFIKTIMKGESLLVRATPYSESAITADFDTTGLESAIAPLKAACRWKS